MSDVCLLAELFLSHQVVVIIVATLVVRSFRYMFLLDDMRCKAIDENISGS